MPQEKLVRIHPDVPCEKYVVLWGDSAITLDKTQGWYRVDETFANYISEFRVHDSSPAALKVFEIRLPSEAKAIEEAEKKVADPKGTADKPRDITARELPLPDRELAAARARTRGRKGDA